MNLSHNKLNPKTSHRVLIGIACAFLAAIGFSIKSILIKLAFSLGVDSVTLLALRMSFSLPFFILMAYWGKFKNNTKYIQTKTKTATLSNKEWLIILGLSIAYYLFNFLDFLGLQNISAGLERMIQFLYPTMTVLLSAWLYKKTLSKKVIIAMMLSYAGIGLVFIQEISLQQSNITLGSTLVFISALFYAIYLVGSGHIIAQIGATRLTAYAMIIACLASIIQFGLSHPLAAIQQSFEVYKIALTMAIFSTVLPVFMLAIGMRLIGSARTSLIGSIGPIFTLYLAHVFLNENVTLLQLLGSILVLLGVIFISRNQKEDFLKVST
jgi:drug/metabolite transporter (DMT)-like permease